MKTPKPEVAIGIRQVVKERWIACAILFLLALVMHFWGLRHPSSVVFDEVHFGKFVDAYTHSHQRIFDIHPPHSKLLIAGLAKVAGYRGGFSFEKIDQPFREPAGERNVDRIRWMPAVWGSLIPVVAFILLGQLGVPLLWALLGAGCLLFDNGTLVQTRVIALDGCLLLSSLLCLCFCVEAQRSNSKRATFAIALGAGMAAALAVGTKFTGLVVPALAFLMILFGPGPAMRARKFAGFATGFAVLYLAGWMVHFAILTQPGYADQFYRLSGNFFTDFWQLQKVMLNANAGITTGHPDQSLWWKWPLLSKPVFYWENHGSRIYFIGNPVVWLLPTLVTIWLTVLLFLGKLPSKGKARWIRIFLLGFWASWLPYAFVSRALFLYHFLPPLYFAVLASTTYLSNWFEKKRFERTGVAVIATAVLAGFLLFLPLTYGFRANDSYDLFMNKNFLH